MANQHYSYLLWIISFSIHIYHMVNLTNVSTYINNGLILITQWISIIAYSFISMVFGIVLYIIINHYRLQTSMATNIKVKKYTKITDLPNFTSLKSYRSFYINGRTSPLTIDEFIAEAILTHRFTIVTGNNILTNKMFIEIEFVQELQSLILFIEMSYDYPSVVIGKINHLCAIIFDSSNIIQTWGYITSDLLLFREYDFAFYDSLSKVHLLYVREHFKDWYNQAFNHNENCDQILDYNDIDGPLCSCSHRPYKCLNDQWSLVNATAYTFAEHLNIENDNAANECLSITKLATVIQEQWTREQINDFIKEHHINDEIENVHI